MKAIFFLFKFEFVCVCLYVCYCVCVCLYVCFCVCGVLLFHTYILQPHGLQTNFIFLVEKILYNCPSALCDDFLQNKNDNINKSQSKEIRLCLRRSLNICSITYSVCLSKYDLCFFSFILFSFLFLTFYYFKQLRYS